VGAVSSPEWVGGTASLVGRSGTEGGLTTTGSLAHPRARTTRSVVAHSVVSTIRWAWQPATGSDVRNRAGVRRMLRTAGASAWAGTLLSVVASPSSSKLRLLWSAGAVVTLFYAVRTIVGVSVTHSSPSVSRRRAGRRVSPALSHSGPLWDRGRLQGHGAAQRHCTAMALHEGQDETLRTCARAPAACRSRTASFVPSPEVTQSSTRSASHRTGGRSPEHSIRGPSPSKTRRGEASAPGRLSHSHGAESNVPPAEPATATCCAHCGNSRRPLKGVASTRVVCDGPVSSGP
jgi:hypothetical protein